MVWVYKWCISSREIETDSWPKKFQAPKMCVWHSIQIERCKSKLKCPIVIDEVEKTWDFDVIESKWVEPPIPTRRHLSKPLNRIGKSEC